MSKTAESVSYYPFQGHFKYLFVFVYRDRYLVANQKADMRMEYTGKGESKKGREISCLFTLNQCPIHWIQNRNSLAHKQL